MKIQIAALTIGLGIFASSFAHASMPLMKAFKSAYPTAKVGVNCKLCHEGAPPRLNYYGMDLQKANLDFVAIEALDSDGDGVANGEEINKGTSPGVKD